MFSLSTSIKKYSYKTFFKKIKRKYSKVSPIQVKLTLMEEQKKELVDHLQDIRQLQLNDRSIMDKATRAFVSYIRSYSKHECNVILRVKGTTNNNNRKIVIILLSIHRRRCQRYCCVEIMSLCSCHHFRFGFGAYSGWFWLIETAQNARDE